MTLFELFDLTSYIAGKFPSAGAIPPSRFNLLLPQVQDELFNREKDTVALDPFKEITNVDPDEYGMCRVPTGYRKMLSASTQSFSWGSQVRPIDLLLEWDFNARRTGVMTRADERPFMKVSDGVIYMVPFNITRAEISYLRDPVKPYMDWCVLASNPNKIIYMPVGSYLVYSAGQWYLRTSTTMIQNNVWKDGDLYNGMPSATVELEWELQYHYRLVSLLLSKIGVNLGEFEVTKYAEMMPK